MEKGGDYLTRDLSRDKIKDIYIWKKANFFKTFKFTKISFSRNDQQPVGLFFPLVNSHLRILGVKIPFDESSVLCPLWLITVKVRPGCRGRGFCD